MSKSLAIRSAFIIGAMTPPTSTAPFNRASLVVRSGEGQIAQVLTYTSEGNVEGPSLTEEEWKALVATEQALPLQNPVALVSGAALWVLRPGLPRRERALHDLRAHGVLIHEHIPGSGDAWLCLVNESHSAASALRDRWRQDAIDTAQTLGSRGQWPRAMAEAEIAHAVSRGLDPDALALLILTYERCGRDVRGKGIIAMARRSRGEDFSAQITERLALLRRDLSEPEVAAKLAPNARAAPRKNALLWKSVYNLAKRGNTRDLQGFRHTKEAA